MSPVSSQNPAFLARCILIAAILLAMVISAVGAYHRTPWSDEGWFSSASYNLARHGFMGTTVMESAGTHFTRIEQRTYWVFPVFLLGQALWYEIFPPTLFWTRVFTIIWLPVAVIALQRFLQATLPRSKAPILASCLFALSFIMMDDAGFGRPDLMCCALGLAGLATYAVLRTRNLARALLISNTLVALSGLSHPNGIFHLLGLAVLIFWYDRQRLRLPVLALAALPYLCFGLLWALYISQDPTAFLDQMKANGTNDRWTSTLNPLKIVWNEVTQRYLVAFGLITRGVSLIKLYALAAYVAGIAGCLLTPRLRRQDGTRLLLTLFWVYFIALCIFNQKLTYYLIHILPFFLALLALWIDYLWQEYPRARMVIAAAVAVLIAIEGGGILLKAYTRSYAAEQRAAVQYAQQHTGPQDRIESSAALLYEFGFDSRLRDDPYLGLQSGRAPDAIILEPLSHLLYEAWKTERPAEMRRIEQRLKEYRLAYHSKDYEVYLRQSR